MKEEINVPTENERDLIENFSNYRLPEAFYKMGGRTPFGSISFTKMVYFMAQSNFQNSDYDTISAIRPERQPDETYERYKKRQKFQKFIGKWKPYFYDYSVYEPELNQNK
jgi:hypothetical protein